MDKTKLHPGMEKAVKQSASHWKQSPLILGDILLNLHAEISTSGAACPYRNGK